MLQMKPKFPKKNLKLKRHCTKLFEEMCDLLFEIAAKDDDVQKTKSRYLNTFLNGFNQKRTYIQRIQRTFQILLQDHIHTPFKKTVIVVLYLLHLDTWTNAKAYLLLAGTAVLKVMSKPHAESWVTFQGATTRLNTLHV